MTENVQKSFRKRLQQRWAMRTALAGVLGMAPKALGASPGRFGDTFGWLLAALGTPGAPQDQLWGALWVSKNRPERVWTHSRNSLGRPKRLKIECSLILGRFGMDFRRFSNDLSSIFLRAACDEGTEQNLKKESRDPQRTCCLLRFAVASYCSHVLRNDF